MKKIIFLILFFILIPPVLAFEIYTKPAQLDFGNVLVNSSIEKRMTVLTDSQENIEISLSASKPFEDWITAEPSAVQANTDHPAEFILKINPPQAQLGVYHGIIIVNAVYSGSDLTSSISSAAALDFKISLTNTEIIQARVKNLVVDNVEAGQVPKIKFFIFNEGNKEINPIFEIKIYDSQKNLIKSFSQTQTVTPSVDQKEIEFNLDSSLAEGSYQVVGRVFLNDYLVSQQTAPFKIVAPGTLPPEPEKIVVALEEVIPLSSTSTLIFGLVIVAVFVYYGAKRMKKKSKRKK